jgi:hypothetical protein
VFIVVVAIFVWLFFLRRPETPVHGDVELGVPDVTSSEPGVTIGSEGYWSKHDDSSPEVP